MTGTEKNKCLSDSRTNEFIRDSDVWVKRKEKIEADWKKGTFILFLKHLSEQIMSLATLVWKRLQDFLSGKAVPFSEPECHFSIVLYSCHSICESRYWREISLNNSDVSVLYMFRLIYISVNAYTSVIYGIYKLNVISDEYHSCKSCDKLSSIWNPCWSNSCTERKNNWLSLRKPLA